MNTILYELGDVLAVVYLDDIIVFGRTVEEHNENLIRILQAMRKHNLKIEPSKCQILKSELDYLGHTIDANGVHPKKENVQAVKTWRYRRQ